MVLPPTYAYDPNRQYLSLSPRDQAFVQNPYPTYAALHDASGPDGPVVYWEDYGFWVFGGLDTVNALFRDRRLGRQILHVASREQLGLPEQPTHLADFYGVEAHSILELEPPDHTRLRGLINRAFVSRHIETLGPSIAARADALMDGMAGKASVDLIAEFAEPLAVSVIADMLGISARHGPQLLDWSHAMVRMYQAERSHEDELAANQASKSFVAWVRELVQLRRQNSADDLLSHLINVKDLTGRLSEDEVVSTVILLLNAGHEATVHAMGHAMNLLLGAESGNRQSWLQDPPSLVEEALRHRPPLHMFTRFVLEDCQLGGRRFALGDVIGLHLGMANHDPRQAREPNQFDPARDTVRQVAFGAGIHFCIGHTLARLEMETALPALFRRFPVMKVKTRPKLKDAYHFHGLEALEVTLQ